VADDLRIASLAALFFSLAPGYTQAVVWVSGVTGLLMTACYVGSLVAQARSWRASGMARPIYETVAATLCLAALLSHEAAITLPVVSWILWQQFGPSPLTRRRFLTASMIVAVLVFASLTALANHRNTVFTESHYAVGPHVIRHGFDYAVSLYVGSPSRAAYVAVGLVVAVLAVATPETRFGALWLVVAMLPYLGFTWSNVSRYLYLPTIGFSWALAAAVVQAAAWFERRATTPGSRTAARATLAVLAAFVAIRFARFDVPSIRSLVAWTVSWRASVDMLVRNTPAPAGEAVRVTAAPNEIIDPMYVAPLVQWVYRDYRLAVTVDR